MTTPTLIESTGVKTSGQEQGFLTRASLGLAIVLCGQPIGWAIRGQVGGGENPIYPIVPLVIGLLLLFDIERFVKGQFSIHPILPLALVSAILIPLAAFSLAVGDFGFRPGLYHLFSIALLMAISTARPGAFHNLETAIFAVAVLASALPLAELMLIGPGEYFIRLRLLGNANTIIVGNIAALGLLVGSLIIFSRRIPRLWMQIVMSLAMLVLLGALLLSGTRSAMLIVISGIVLIGFSMRHEISKRWRPILKSLSVLVVVVLVAGVGALIYLQNLLGPELVEVFVGVYIDRLLGIAGLFQDTGLDQSLSIRTSFIAETWQGLTFFGHGPMALALSRGDPSQYAHLAYLQAFYDLGIVGGAWFFLSALIFPVSLVFAAYRRWHSNIGILCGCCLVGLAIITQFTHGDPYSSRPIMFLLVGVILAVRSSNMPGFVPPHLIVRRQ